MNPFDIWAESSNKGVGIDRPSVFGALPYLYPSTGTVSYYFTATGPMLFNCKLIDSNSRTVYRVVTDKEMPGYTLIKNRDKKNISLIEWQTQPYVEVRGVMKKQLASTWLTLSDDKLSRKMTIRGMSYTWAPRKSCVNLYAGTTFHGKLLASITNSGKTLRVDLSPDAVQLDILDAIATAALLLQCGRNVD